MKIYSILVLVCSIVSIAVASDTPWVGGMAQGDQMAFDVHAINDTVDYSLAGQYKNISDSSLLWGAYRAGLYFGVRPRIPRSLLSGLMWFNVDNYGGIGKVRHFYEQHDNMNKANWVHYDPRIGGRQHILDQDCHVDITIDFVKSEDGQSWGVKVKSSPHKGFEHVKTSFVWYSGLESEVKEKDIFGQDKNSGYLNLDMERDFDGAYKDEVRLGGVTEDLGIFSVSINSGSSNKHPKPRMKSKALDPRLLHHISLRVPNDSVWQAKEIFMTLLQDSLQDLTQDGSGLEKFPPEQALIIRDMNKFEGNLHIVQQVFQGECEFNIIFDNAMTPDYQKITSDNIETKVSEAISKIEKKFKSVFDLKPPFNSEKYQPFAQEILAGLLGGLSYFYGDHLVDRETIFDEESFESYDLKGELEGPFELFSLVPSRPFFPRGFLWDEGFHLLPLLNYDSDLVLEILRSWFNLIDDEGWLAREQILGPELRSRVPEPFRVQSPQIVNPPTLMLLFTYLLDNVNSVDFGDITSQNNYNRDMLNGNDIGNLVLSNPELLTNFTKEVYPKLQQHYEMFRRTQKGYTEEFDRPANIEAYRWRGRTETHCLASGIDDYPRALPADIAELNVDLLSWIGVMTRSMKLIAKVLHEEQDFKKYETIEKDITQSLEQLHWSSEHKTYCDLSVDADDENVHVCHKGYISLFPFMTKFIPLDDYEKIENTVDMIASEEQLWTPFGIRSLSKSDANYKTGEDYWKSPIWININYLILDNLKYYKQRSPNMPKHLQMKLNDTYSQLRMNLVNNVFKQWQTTGFVWEQYNDETGKSQGAKNFLGWTSTILLIMNLSETI